MEDPLKDTLELFLSKYYNDEVTDLINDYPCSRSLYVNFLDIDKFNVELAQRLLKEPDIVLHTLREALAARTGKDDLNVRITNNPYKVKIGDIRHEHIGKMVTFDGLVLKSTEVRPRFIVAAFECPFCAHLTYLEQTSPKRLIEPRACDGCGKKGKFIILPEQSKFTDSQKIRLQESLEELRGGDVPATKDVELEGELTGMIAPGDRIIVNGVLRSEIKVVAGTKSPIFEVYIEANAIDVLEKVFDEIEITDDDEREILALSELPTLYEELVSTIAPRIYGLEEIKEALMLQLFSGVPKSMVDGTTIRGDIHVLLVGDPGLAKCCSGDTEILLADGSLQNIKTLLEGQEPSGLVDDGVYVKSNHDLVSLGLDAKTKYSKGDLLWKRQSPPEMYRVLTSSGREIQVTPTHPFFVCGEDAHLRGRKAKDLKEGDFIATPRKIDLFGTPQPLNISYTKSRSYNAVRLKLPDYTTPEFWRFIGLFVAEGYLQTKMQRGYLSSNTSFTNNNSQLLEEYQSFAKKMGLHPSLKYSHKGILTKDVNIPGIEFGTFIENLGGGELSGELTVPRLLFKSSKPEIAAFLSALFDGDGTISADGRMVTIVSASQKLMLQVQHLLLRFGIRSQHHPTWAKATNSSHPKKKRYYRLTVTGADVLVFKSEIGFTVAEKRERLEKILDPSYVFNTNVDVIPNLSSLLQSIRVKLGLSQFQCGIPRSTYQHYERGDRNPSRTALNTVVQQFEKQIKCTNESGKIIELVGALKTLANSDIFWDQVERIDDFVPTDEFVYDFQVQDYHNFVANDIFVHNSQLLSSVVNMAPRGLFTSGSSSSAAGLTAAAVKDEFSEGAWSLEAGALVLSDRGLCAVDELDKMTKHDRDALHEAIEQQRVSVAKAGIVASLHSRCALLAAANPTSGRFDPYEPIAKQVNMPPTLLSRFDLIFMMLDRSDDENDTKLAQYVLETHKRGEAIQKSGEEATETNTITPLLLRKYIAYSRKLIPQISDEAMAKFKDFYVQLRRESRKEDAAIPITVRQLESLVRLGEASARTRLSDVVTEADADRVLALFMYCMKSVYTDPESGHLDVDWVVAGTSKTKRDRASAIRNIMQVLEKELGPDIPSLEILKRAQEDGIEAEKAEKVLELLKRDGILFSPSSGVVRFVR